MGPLAHPDRGFSKRWVAAGASRDGDYREAAGNDGRPRHVIRKRGGAVQAAPVERKWNALPAAVGD